MSDAELAQFRAEWSSELKRTTAAPGETRESTRPNVERTALEYYAEAVHAEDEGRMGEGRLGISLDEILGMLEG